MTPRVQFRLRVFKGEDIAFKGARTAFESIEPDLEKAGRSLGYPEWAVLLRITFPLAWRGIVACPSDTRFRTC